MRSGASRRPSVASRLPSGWVGTGSGATARGGAIGRGRRRNGRSAQHEGSKKHASCRSPQASQRRFLLKRRHVLPLPDSPRSYCGLLILSTVARARCPQADQGSACGLALGVSPSRPATSPAGRRAASRPRGPPRPDGSWPTGPSPGFRRQPEPATRPGRARSGSPLPPPSEQRSTEPPSRRSRSSRPPQGRSSCRSTSNRTSRARRPEWPATRQARPDGSSTPDRSPGSRSRRNRNPCGPTAPGRRPAWSG